MKSNQDTFTEQRVEFIFTLILSVTLIGYGFAYKQTYDSLANPINHYFYENYSVENHSAHYKR